MTTTNESDYYSLKEIVDASMEDSVEVGTLTQDGTLKVNEERFIEILTLRFAEAASANRAYKIRVVYFQEEPPIACVEVKTTITSAKLFGGSETNTVVNRINAILEQKINALAED